MTKTMVHVNAGGTKNPSFKKRKQSLFILILCISAFGVFPPRRIGKTPLFEKCSRTKASQPAVFLTWLANFL